MKVQLILDDKIVNVDTVVFRRLLKAAEHNIEQLKKAEGSQLPPVDAKVLKLIMDMRYEHRDLI